ncbi:MAG: hypothetical protein CL908_13325 [Deltaproteobacteria bacterium]|nr:hypothetical protein [Deltaproteobacteria bacterium]
MKSKTSVGAEIVLSIFLGLGLGPGLVGHAMAQDCVESPPGLMAWWPGDGTTVDAEAGLDAKLVNGSGFSTGLVGEAFSLDGIGGGQDDVILLPRLAADGLADLTVEFWVNTTDTKGTLFSGANGSVPGDNELVLHHESTGLVVWVNQEKSGVLPVSVNDGAWHHVAFVRDGSIGSLYVDGLLVDSRSYPVGPLDIGPHGLMLGQEQDCLAGCFQAQQALDGLIDEVAIYGRALSGSEVLTVAAAGSGGKCKPAPAPDDEIPIESLEAIESEIDTLVDRLADLELRLGNVEATAHQHEQQRHDPPRWGRDGARGHDHSRSLHKWGKKRRH